MEAHIEKHGFLSGTLEPNNDKARKMDLLW